MIRILPKCLPRPATYFRLVTRCCDDRSASLLSEGTAGSAFPPWCHGIIRVWGPNRRRSPICPQTTTQTHFATSRNHWPSSPHDLLPTARSAIGLRPVLLLALSEPT